MPRMLKVPAPATTRGRQFALEALKARRKINRNRKQIDNSSLPAGSPMYFYCPACGDLADTVPEGYKTPPRKLCGECDALKELDWLLE